MDLIFSVELNIERKVSRALEIRYTDNKYYKMERMRMCHMEWCNSLEDIKPDQMHRNPPYSVLHHFQMVAPEVGALQVHHQFVFFSLLICNLNVTVFTYQLKWKELRFKFYSIFLNWHEKPNDEHWEKSSYVIKSCSPMRMKQSLKKFYILKQL